MRVSLLLVSLVLLACAPDAPRPVAQRSTSAAGDEPLLSRCIDPDGDGFGPGCAPGEDCDDDDPAITDACYRCALPTQGCACAADARPVACDVDTGEQVTAATCYVGQRTCREGVWSGCSPYAPRFQ